MEKFKQTWWAWAILIFLGPQIWDSWVSIGTGITSSTSNVYLDADTWVDITLLAFFAFMNLAALCYGPVRTVIWWIVLAIAALASDRVVSFNALVAGGMLVHLTFLPFWAGAVTTHVAIQANKKMNNINDAATKINNYYK